MRTRMVLAAIACALAVCAGSSRAQNNPNARAGLSWSASPGVLDLSSPSALPSLYVQFSGLTQFKGGEVNITWSPAGDARSCAAHVGTLYRTSGDCTYLNRGTSVPIVGADDPGHLHIAWANNAVAQCASGVGLVLQFEMDGCADFAGCFSLTAAWVLDGANSVNFCQLSNAQVTVRGGPCGPASSWGKIKSLFR